MSDKIKNQKSVDLASEADAVVMCPQDFIAEFENKMQCNCDLDRWEPEKTTGHSWVCRIHKAAKSKYRQKMHLGT